MLSYLGKAVEVVHSQDCKQINNADLASHICSTFCPIAQSMSYIANALNSRPTSAKSMLSFTSTQASSTLEESTPEEPSDGECSLINTRATSVTTVPGIERASTSSVKAKAKTVFRLAHPPPISIHKQHLHIRPRVLLQLQRVSETARPTPVLEALPSFVFASRLARRFPRTFKGKAGLGADDLVIVSSEDYNLEGLDSGGLEGSFETDKWDEREIVAAICQPAKDEVESQVKVQICLNNGSLWTVSRLASGAYEFVSIDDHGLRTVARWVPKQARNLQRSSTLGRDRSTSEEKKFNFSLMNPNSRRHAIIASLDRHSIEVSTHYTNPSVIPIYAASSTPTASASSSCEERPQNDPVEVSQSLRTLITVTGICVAFQEGYSTHFRRSDSAPTSPILSTRHQRRSLSLSGSQLSSENSSHPTRVPFSNMQKARSPLLHASSSSAVPSSPRAHHFNTAPRRALSTSGAFFQRSKSRRNTASDTHQLSPVGDYDGSETEITPTRKDSGDASGRSSLYSSATSPRIEEDLPWEIALSSDPDASRLISESTLGATQKPRRLTRMFGLSRRTSEARS